MLDAHTHLPSVEAESCPVCSVYESHRAAVVRVRTQNGQGTGLLITSNGHILTNAHVVGQHETVTVQTEQGTAVAARVVRLDVDADLALLKAEAGDVRWHAEPWDDAAPPRVGSRLFIIGHPVGLGWTVTEGLVSARREVGTVAKIELIQTSAAINPGNSGGPAFDGQGRVIGLVRSKLVGSGVEGIGFVIPWSVVRGFILREPLP